MNWLFDTPWWLPTGIGAVGVALFISGNRRRETNIRNAGAAVVALAGVLAAVSYLVDTDVEKALKRTNEVVQAVIGRNWEALQALLDPQASLSVMGQFTQYENRETVEKGARESAEKFGLRGAKIISKEPRQTGPLITVTFTALSEQDNPPYPLTTTWQFEWKRMDDGWMLNRIIFLKVGERSADEVQSQLPR